MLTKYDSLDLVAALLNEMSRDQVKVHITPERPLKNRGGRGGGYRGKSGRSHSGGYRGNRDRQHGGHSRGHDRDQHTRNNKFVIKNKH
nr:hypothetical protein [Fructilactobacillus florum]